MKPIYTHNKEKWELNRFDSAFNFTFTGKPDLCGLYTDLNRLIVKFIDQNGLAHLTVDSCYNEMRDGSPTGKQFWDVKSYNVEEMKRMRVTKAENWLFEILKIIYTEIWSYDEAIKIEVKLNF
jgi:hypothetical protein